MPNYRESKWWPIVRDALVLLCSCVAAASVVVGWSHAQALQISTNTQRIDETDRNLTAVNKRIDKLEDLTVALTAADAQQRTVQEVTKAQNEEVLRRLDRIEQKVERADRTGR